MLTLCCYLVNTLCFSVCTDLFFVEDSFVQKDAHLCNIMTVKMCDWDLMIQLIVSDVC